MKANFFIIGAAKSGTTSLYKYLNQHSEIYFSPIKEPNYFSTDIDVSKFSSLYKKNTFLDTDLYFAGKLLPDLQLSFVRKEEYYNRLFEKAEGFKVIAESSTSYLYSSVAAQNICDYNPNAKILVVLRNPIARCFSHYEMALRYGHTQLGFREALEKDIAKKEKGWGISELFIELGQYFQQLERYYKIFPKEQIKVILFDDFITDPRKVIGDCFAFLNLKVEAVDLSKKYNEKKLPKNPKLNKLLTRIGAKNLLKQILPQSSQEVLKKVFFKGGNQKYVKSDFDFLLDIYKDEIKNTALLTQRDLSNWMIY